MNWLPITSIDPGERAGRTLGDLTALMKSADTEGLACPVTVSSRGKLITGWRRLAACRELEWTSIPADQITTVPEALAALAAEQADGRHAKPMNLTETMTLDAVIRGELQWPRQPQPPGTPVKGTERRQRTIAVVLGLSSARHYREARDMYAAAHGYREAYGTRTPVDPEVRRRAVRAMASISDGAAITAAYRTFKIPDRVLDPNGRPMPARRQQQAIASAVAALAGIAAGLAGVGPISPDTSAADAAQWSADMRAARTVLAVFNRKLKEHSNGNDISS